MYGELGSDAKDGSVYAPPFVVSWNSTSWTPPGAGSLADAATGAVARRFAAATGAVSAVVGAVRSIVTGTVWYVCAPGIVDGGHGEQPDAVRRDRPGDGVGEGRVDRQGRPVGDPAGGARAVALLERDVVDAGARVGRGRADRLRIRGGDVDRRVDVDREARGGVVDHDRAERRDEDVAGHVAGRDAEVVVAVAEGRRIPRDRVRRGRVGDADRRPGAGRRGRDLEERVQDARERVGRVRADGDGAARDGRARAGGGQRAGREGRVDDPRVARLGRIGVAGRVRRPHLEGARAVAEGGGDRERSGAGSPAARRRRCTRRWPASPWP